MIGHGWEANVEATVQARCKGQHAGRTCASRMQSWCRIVLAPSRRLVCVRKSAMMRTCRAPDVTHQQNEYQ